MKQDDLKRIIAALAAAALMLFLAPRVTEARTHANGDNLADTEMEHVLLNSGFKVKSASNGGQRSHISRLPDNEFQQVMQNGKTYYLYADKRDNRLYVGDEYAYRAYLGYLHNKKLRKQGVFVWEVRPADRANNKTIEIWHGWTPFPEWSNSRRNDQSLPPNQ